MNKKGEEGRKGEEEVFLFSLLPIMLMSFFFFFFSSRMWEIVCVAEKSEECEKRRSGVQKKEEGRRSESWYRLPLVTLVKSIAVIFDSFLPPISLSLPSSTIFQGFFLSWISWSTNPSTHSPKKETNRSPDQYRPPIEVLDYFDRELTTEKFFCSGKEEKKEKKRNVCFSVLCRNIFCLCPTDSIPEEEGEEEVVRWIRKPRFFLFLFLHFRALYGWKVVPFMWETTTSRVLLALSSLLFRREWVHGWRKRSPTTTNHSAALPVTSSILEEGGRRGCDCPQKAPHTRTRPETAQEGWCWGERMKKGIKKLLERLFPS